MSSSLPTATYVIGGREMGNVGNSVERIIRKSAAGNNVGAGWGVPIYAPAPDGGFINSPAHQMRRWRELPTWGAGVRVQPMLRSELAARELRQSVGAHSNLRVVFRPSAIYAPDSGFVNSLAHEMRRSTTPPRAEACELLLRLFYERDNSFYDNDIDAKDILQNVIVSIYRYPHRFRDEKDNSFRNWSYSIIRNKILKHLKQSDLRLLVSSRSIT